MSANLQFILAAVAVLFAVTVLSQDLVSPPKKPICKPKCTGGPHDQCKSCASACPLTCDNPEVGPCTKQCVVNKCECESGYVRNDKGKCVKPEECPLKCTKKCTGGPHDKCSLCASACPPTCEKPNPGPCILVCRVNVCECEKGYVRAPNGKCVRLENCPKNSTDCD